MGIHRTQFNRYLSGESWPRPDVLKVIVEYLGVDANNLLYELDGSALGCGSGDVPGIGSGHDGP